MKDYAQMMLLAREHGTPLYIYDLRRLKDRVVEIRQALSYSRARLFFATMANDRLPILKFLSTNGLGACVNSTPHLLLAQEAGFSADEIQFTSTGLTQGDMRILQSKRIRANLDSLAQLRAWFSLDCKRGGIRVNASSLGSATADRIGVSARDIPIAMQIAVENRADLEGIHIYVGTNFQTAEAMLPVLDNFFLLAESVPTLQYVNIGGGIGVDYEHSGAGFDLQRFGKAVAKYAERLRKRLNRDVQIIFEPGRGLVADCGVFLTSITDSKTLEGLEYVTVDGSIAIFPRPFHHPETPHRIEHLQRNVDPILAKQLPNAIVVGRTTFSRDILGTIRFQRPFQIGDVLAIFDAGAYSQSMASRFLGQPEPAVLFLNESFSALQKENKSIGRLHLATSEY